MERLKAIAQEMVTPTNPRTVCVCSGVVMLYSDGQVQNVSPVMGTVMSQRNVCVYLELFSQGCCKVALCKQNEIDISEILKTFKVRR